MGLNDPKTFKYHEKVRFPANHKAVCRLAFFHTYIDNNNITWKEEL